MRHHPKFAALPRAKRGLAFTVMLTVALAMSACAQAGTLPTSSGGSASPSTPAAPSTTPSKQSAGASPGNAASGCKAQLSVVASDANKTLCVTVGGTVTIDLGPSATSAADPFDVSGDSLRQGAAEGTFTAVSPGTALITAQRRNCPKPSSGMAACNSIQLWKVTITVE